MSNNRNTGIVLGGLALLAFMLHSSKAEAVETNKPGYPASARAINNPGNIKHEAKKYPGEIESPSDVFKSFESLAHGYAAMIIKLRSYFASGYDTLDKIINHWAPASDNNTPEAYVDYIVDRMADIAVDPDEIFPITDDDTVLSVISLMSDVEQGHQFGNIYWSDAVASFNLV